MLDRTDRFVWLLGAGLFALGLGGCDDESAGSITSLPPADVQRDAATAVPKPVRQPDAGNTVDDSDAMGEAIDADAGPDDNSGACADGDERQCADGCGVETCADGAFGPCGGATLERCNGFDDNCDGEIDEAFPGLGIGCSIQIGACQAQGVKVCAADGNGTICEAEPVEPEAEVCDGLDNDCDNSVDEDFPGQQCCTEDIHCSPADECVAGRCERRDGVGPGPGNPGGNPEDPFRDLFPEPGAACATATVMPGFGNYPGNTFGVGNADSGSCGGSLGGEVVYSFTLPVQVEVQLDTYGSLSDTAVYVRTGCADVFSEVVCNDDNALGPQGAVRFTAQANQQYFVFVDSFILGGSFVLNFGEAGPEPECRRDFDCELGEDCVGGACVVPPCRDSFECPGQQLCQAGICVEPPPPVPVCDTAIEMAAFGSYDADTSGRGNQQDASCGPATGGEAVFTFQLDVETQVRFDTFGSDFDTILSVRTACDAQNAEVVCNDDGEQNSRSEVSFAAQAGVRYFVMVDGYGGESGLVDLVFSETAVQVPDPDPAPDPDPVPDPDPPVGICADPIPIVQAGVINGSTAGMASVLDGDCGGAGGKEVIYVLSPAESTGIHLDTRGSSFDTVISVFAPDCMTQLPNLCNDDLESIDPADRDLTSELDFRAVAGEIYFIVVEGYAPSDEGDFVLNVRTY